MDEPVLIAFTRGLTKAASITRAGRFRPCEIDITDLVTAWATTVIHTFVG